MKIDITYYAFIFLSGILLSCTKDISLDAGERVVVVECILSCDSVQKLRLFYSHAKEAIPSENIDKANVELFDETENNFVRQFQYTSDRWCIDYAAEPEHTYRLEIDIDGYKRIFARQTMTRQVKVVGGLHCGALWAGEAGFEKYGSEFFGTAFYIHDIPEKTWIYALAYDEKTGETHIVDGICTDYPNVDNLFLTGETYEPYRIEVQIKDEGIYPLIICRYLKGYRLSH